MQLVQVTPGGSMTVAEDSFNPGNAPIETCRVNHKRYISATSLVLGRKLFITGCEATPMATYRRGVECLIMY